MQAFQYFYTHVLKQTPKRKTAQDHFGYVSYFSKLKVHPKICLTINQEVFQMSLLLGLVEGSIPSVVNFFYKKDTFKTRKSKHVHPVLPRNEVKWQHRLQPYELYALEETRWLYQYNQYTSEFNILSKVQNNEFYNKEQKKWCPLWISRLNCTRKIQIPLYTRQDVK